MKKYICIILASLTFLESGFLVRATAENTDITQEKTTAENTNITQEKATTENTNITQEKATTENTNITQEKTTTTDKVKNIAPSPIKASWWSIKQNLQTVGTLLTIETILIINGITIYFNHFQNQKLQKRVISAIKFIEKTTDLSAYERENLSCFIIQYLLNVPQTGFTKNPYFFVALDIIKLIEKGRFKEAYNALPNEYRYNEQNNTFSKDFTVNLNNIKPFYDMINSKSYNNSDDLLKYVHTYIIMSNDLITKENIDQIEFVGTCNKSTFNEMLKTLQLLDVSLKTNDTSIHKLFVEFYTIKNALNKTSHFK